MSVVFFLSCCSCCNCKEHVFGLLDRFSKKMLCLKNEAFKKVLIQLHNSPTCMMQKKLNDSMETYLFNDVAEFLLYDGSQYYLNKCLVSFWCLILQSLKFIFVYT